MPWHDPRRLLLYSSLFFTLTVKSQVVTFGPTIHWNFSDIHTEVSAGLECALWYGYQSIDFGFDISKLGSVIYTEYQTGEVFVGLSVGPCLYINNKTAELGIQGSGWLNYFAGVDLRFRKTKSVQTISPGLYFKIINNTPNFHLGGNPLSSIM